jgi:phenylalanyl-tRNA synthetase beta chain
VFRVGDPVDEREQVAFVMAGSVMGFPGEDRSFDVFDGKGAVAALMEALGVGSWSLDGPAGAAYHPGRSASVAIGATQVGTVGEVHPRVARELDLPDRVIVGEVDVTAMGDHAARMLEIRQVPRFPPARRDLAWVVDAGVPAGRVEDVIEEAGGELLEAARLFDLFTGAPIPEGKKSLAFAVTFRAPDRTLTDEEVDAAVAAIDQLVAAEVGGELRAG